MKLIRWWRARKQRRAEQLRADLEFVERQQAVILEELRTMHRSGLCSSTISQMIREDTGLLSWYGICRERLLRKLSSA